MNMGVIHQLCFFNKPMQTYEYILIALSVGQFLTMIVGFYKFFRDPDEKAEKSLSVLTSNCTLKHNRIDEIILEIKKSVEGINYTFEHFKENEFNHIESEVRRMSDVQTKILTILDERLPRSEK